MEETPEKQADSKVSVTRTEEFFFSFNSFQFLFFNQHSTEEFTELSPTICPKNLLETKPKVQRQQ